MGFLCRCFCDPFKLTYVSAIITSVEAVVFAVLNIVLICMYTCAIQPPSSVALGFDKFWADYFFDQENCDAKGVDTPWWTNSTFPLADYDRSLTTPYDNFVYQVTYLALHTAWFLTALILIYGNARKKWGYYLPWLLVSTAILVMDVTVSAFCIQDMVTIESNQYRSAMFWILALYFRLFLIWFMNMSQFASAFNAFWKARHKRTKQEHERRKLAKAHAEELARAEAATEARVRAQMAEQQAAQEMEMRPKIPPPVPKKPTAPSELRPFSYLNPAYRPNDPTDVEGMRANPTHAPHIPMKPLHLPPPEGPYFPDDGYTRTRHLEGLPRRYDSMRNFSTQNPHPALRRFSSIRDHTSFPVSWPSMPAPDYDMTMRPRRSPSNQSEYKRHDCWESCSSGKYTSPSFPVIHAAASIERNPRTSYIPIQALTQASPTTSTPTVTSHPHQTASRRASLPDIIPPQTPSRPSPILYTQTASRTHLQIYTSSSDAEDDSLSLQGAQGDKLIFGGVFVPLHCRRATSYIANSFLKAEGREREEFPEMFWDAQWRSMREGRANSPQKQCVEATNDLLPHISHKSDKKLAIVADKEERKSHAWKTMAQGKHLAPVPRKGSLVLLSPGDDRTNLTKVGNNNNSNDTVDSSRTLGTEATFNSKPGASNRRTLPAQRLHKHTRRKLSETYIDVSFKRESRGPSSHCPPRPLSVSSEDLLPSDPAFPIMHRAVRIYAH